MGKNNFYLSVLIIFCLFICSVSAESSSSSSPFAGFGIILTVIMIYQINKSEKIAIKEAGDKRIGVAGWLLFFIGLLAISGSIVIVRIINDLIQMIIYGHLISISLQFIFTEILDLVTGIASIIAVYYLWKIKPGAKWLAIGVLTFDIIVIGLNWLIAGDELYIILSFMTLIWDVIMIIYFLSSHRVKNTYVLNAKIPKKHASSNSTVFGWIVYQAVISIVLLVVFQFSSWGDMAKLSEDKQCIDYCDQYPETDSYYFGYDGGIGGMLCQCQKAGEVISSTSFLESNYTAPSEKNMDMALPIKETLDAGYYLRLNLYNETKDYGDIKFNINLKGSSNFSIYFGKSKSSLDGERYLYKEENTNNINKIYVISNGTIVEIYNFNEESIDIEGFIKYVK